MGPRGIGLGQSDAQGIASYVAAAGSCLDRWSAEVARTRIGGMLRCRVALLTCESSADSGSSMMMMSALEYAALSSGIISCSLSNVR